MSLRKSFLTATTGVALAGALSPLLHPVPPAVASGVQFSTTRIGLTRESVDGTRGQERLVGHVDVQSQRSWRRTSRNGAPSGRFTVAEGGCTADVHISLRAVATSQGAQTRARAVTQVGSTRVIADGTRPGGWLRVVQLRGGLHARGAQLYGIAIARVAKSRWADVRAYGFFSGCTSPQISTGPAARSLPRLLETAAIHARVVRASA